MTGNVILTGLALRYLRGQLYQKLKVNFFLYCSSLVVIIDSLVTQSIHAEYS